MKPITESNIEQYAIENLQRLGWEYLHGLETAPGAENGERESFEQVVLTGRLNKAVAGINPHIPEWARQQAVKTALGIYSPQLIHNNGVFHNYLVEKIKVPYQQEGFDRSYEAALIDFDNPRNNSFLAVNQFTVQERNFTKRPDIVLFVNGIPLVVIELKNAADENATIESAYRQIETYKALVPGLFTYNAFCVISDGLQCRAGSISAGQKRFMAWKSAEGEKEASRFTPQLETLIKGMLNPETLLDIIRNFIVFQTTRREDTATGITQVHTEKILAAYHQYYAVNKAVDSTIKASQPSGDKKGGVVWHTQGSGKSLSMVFYAARLITHPAMENPTIVVITDRNDLDDQLFDTFAASTQLLRQEPVQAENREHLKSLLKVASGGIVFTTIQKFMPEAGMEEYEKLSDRRNIVVIADEAHRTQYGFEASLKDIVDKETGEVTGKRLAYGFAKYMHMDALPQATYIGFTGTPIEGTDVNTPQVFGNYVDVYDISRSVEDGATVRIYYESRLAQVNLDEEGKRLIEEFDARLEQDEEITEKERAKAKWAKLEAIVGNRQRLKNLAGDIVTHFEKRLAVFEGKALVVAMSRRIAAELYKEIISLKPGWHNDDPDKGAIKVIMTASSTDGPELSRHHTTKQQRRLLADRMKDPADPLKMVIVIDMWLTGFDVPCLHTMYLDKPMRGHNLMQAIARVNRVFKDKPGGLIVDYLGLASDLKKALSFYSASGGKGDPAEKIGQAVAVMLEKLETVRQMFNESSSAGGAILAHEPRAYYTGGTKFNYSRFFTGSGDERLQVILQAEEHILGLNEGKTRFIKEVTLLSQAFALSVPHPSAMEIKEEVAFFQAVKSGLAKFDGEEGGKSIKDYDSAIKMIIDSALSSGGVVDIFEAAGMRKPEISILSDEFLLEVKGMEHKNLAFELLKKILNDEIKTGLRTNYVKSRKFLEMIEQAVKRYQNNLLTTSQIIDELIAIAREVRESDKDAEKLGLTKDEVAFYNALEANGSAVEVLGDETLKTIALEIADKVKKNTTIDWTIRENSRAKIMVLVRRTLKKYRYPPDKQQEAIDTVLKQAELLADQLN